MQRRALASVVSLAVASACSSTTVDPAVAALTPDVASFTVEHRLDMTVPDGAADVRIWFPLPRREDGQEVSDLQVDAPSGWRQTEDALGNRYVYADVKPTSGQRELAVVTRFRVTRHEHNADVDPAHTRPLTDADRAAHTTDLASNQHIVVDDGMRQLAAEIRGDEQNPVRVARRLYDWVLDNVEYWVKDPVHLKASPVGSSEYCLRTRTGNCTDFHSLWVALARASGIPARMKYGSLFKPSLDGADRDASYHCWPEFFAPGIGWIPLDVAVADIFVGDRIALEASAQEKVVLTTATGYDGPDRAWVDYYFGNLEARRVTWSLGRDLTLEPRQQAGPVNAVAKGYVEVDGAPSTAWQRKMTFRQERP